MSDPRVHHDPKCFFCFDYISIIKKSIFLSDVDHFFPDILKGIGFSGYVDGIWNLVLSCNSCNRGENGKFAKFVNKVSASGEKP